MVEAFKDVSMHLAPLQITEALEMLAHPQGRKIPGRLMDTREAELESLVEVTLRISMLIHSFPRIREIDINPVNVDGNGNRPAALDARALTGTVV